MDATRDDFIAGFKLVREKEYAPYDDWKNIKENIPMIVKILIVFMVLKFFRMYEILNIPIQNTRTIPEKKWQLNWRSKQNHYF